MSMTLRSDVSIGIVGRPPDRRVRLTIAIPEGPIQAATALLSREEAIALGEMLLSRAGVLDSLAFSWSPDQPLGSQGSSPEGDGPLRPSDEPRERS